MSAIDVGDDGSTSTMTGSAPAPPKSDPETRHRLRKALRILLAARRRDERGPRQDGS